jgi:sporulation protein YlmC with PRC-barrel domain
MIRIYSLYDGWCLTEITPVVKQVQLSGSLTQPARKATFSMVYSLTDYNQPRVQIGPGTLISIVESDTNKELFRGQVIDRTLDSSGQQESFTCIDYMKFIMKSSSSMNIKNMAPEDVAKSVCGNFTDMGIKQGIIATTGVYINRVCSELSYYNIIMQCYTQASKQFGLQYIPIMQSDKFNIITKGQLVSDYKLQSLKSDPYNNNVISMTYKDTIENMINQVLIYDKEGNYYGHVEDTSLKKSYGLMQTTYTQEDDKDCVTVANNKLFGFSDEISIEAIGNSNCITGYAVPINIWYLDLLNNAIGYIIDDTHTWECGTGKYTMKLTVSLTNKMDLQGVDS